jgi:hypothetical protein
MWTSLGRLGLRRSAIPERVSFGLFDTDRGAGVPTAFVTEPVGADDPIRALGGGRRRVTTLGSMN